MLVPLIPTLKPPVSDKKSPLPDTEDRLHQGSPYPGHLHLSPLVVTPEVRRPRSPSETFFRSIETHRTVTTSTTTSRPPDHSFDPRAPSWAPSWVPSGPTRLESKKKRGVNTLEENKRCGYLSTKSMELDNNTFTPRKEEGYLFSIRETIITHKHSSVIEDNPNVLNKGVL